MGAQQMKLINPTDRALDRAFAIEVAGWRTHPTESKKCFDQTSLSCYWSDVPEFTQSTDAVLPWLQKCAQVSIYMLGPVWRVSIDMKGTGIGAWWLYTGCDHHDKSLPRAACIALLRSKGISVEFTGEGRT